MTDTDVAESQMTEGSAPPPDVEARARAQGWRPENEYRPKDGGRPWVDAKTFLEAADEFMPVARERNRQLETKLTESQTELRSLRGEVGELKQVLTDFREFASLGEERAYKKALRELTDRRDVAVQHADMEAFRQADSEIAELNKTARTAPAAETKPAPTAQTQTPSVDPVVASWVSENPWFNDDIVLHNLAKGLDADYLKSKPGLSASARLTAVKAEVQRRYPEKFENPLRDTPSSVAAPRGTPPSRAPKHSYENLPPDAKKACDKYVKSIPGYTREEYVKAYEWDD